MLIFIEIVEESTTSSSWYIKANETEDSYQKRERTLYDQKLKKAIEITYWID